MFHGGFYFLPCGDIILRVLTRHQYSSILVTLPRDPYSRVLTFLLSICLRNLQHSITSSGETTTINLIKSSMLPESKFNHRGSRFQYQMRPKCWQSFQGRGCFTHQLPNWHWRWIANARWNPRDAHRDVHKHQQLERTFHSVLLCVHTPGPLGGLSLRGWPTAPYSGCLNPVWVLLYPPCLHCSPSGTWLSVPPSRQSPPPPPQGTSKVSWTSAQINVTSDPAGVVSGSAGQRGDKPVFVQQKLRVVLYLKRAIITSVTGVLTGRRSCRGAVHHGNARPRNRWNLKSNYDFFFASVCTACTWPIVSGLMGVASSWLVQTASATQHQLPPLYWSRKKKEAWHISERLMKYLRIYTNTLHGL